ncbi:uncharacterized protein KGF55_002845 [Candida pseudojiufengensis]|uniref:uncharacterized protein n=1 Tax=Candida pseudojiufengensis TaxID=497109 RepID=UPI00222404A4|nr:uncharacterized protein KGF55_002845 [Candida pseudojiufengensis]KAI5963053.1 hypothetical protein KGF55_002845 [Candida pseudojiufengensis]
MKYTSVSLTYIKDKSTIHASSGILITSKKESFVLTINHIPNINDYKIYSNYEPNKSITNVQWNEIKIIEEIELNQDFQFFKNEFHIFPSDQFFKSTISLLKLTAPTNMSKKLMEFKLDLNFKIGESIKIISSPFNLTNPFIFNNFINYSHIVNQINDEDYLLCDLKYLDNMNGGIVVNSLNDQIIGLVLGSLRKINGDGDLTIIIPFIKIFKLLKMNEFSINSSTTNSLTSSSIIPIKIKSSNKYTWGSCVLYKSNVLITNHHVISPLFNEISSSALIISPNNQTLAITKNQIKTPMKELDLSFIFLDQPIQDLNPIIPCRNYKVETKVYTESYGLYLNVDNLKPMICPGFINYIYSNQNNLNGMIISSTSCFNGSSGGGLFNFQNNEFLGIICSNAQIKKFKPFEAIKGKEDNKEEFEKITNFTFILPIDLIDYCFNQLIKEKVIKIDSKIIDLWKLKSFHQEIFIDLPENRSKL